MKLAYHALTGEKVAIKIMDKKSLGVGGFVTLSDSLGSLLACVFSSFSLQF